jgi:hypothetical protein
MRPNYLALPSPMNLTPPPAWFLADMAVFDPELVIFPSQEESVYRLCRRTRGPLPALDFMHSPDAKICREHKLAPVKAILPPPLVHWGPVILNDLAQYDIQRHGGGNKAARILDEREAAAESSIDRQIADEAGVRAGHAYRELGFHLGTSVHLGVKKPEGAGAYGQREKGILGPNGKPARRVYRPSGSGEHAVFVGR